MNANSKVKSWLPMALCCLPGVAVVTVVVLSTAIGGASLISGPLGTGLVALAVLACPLSMGVMMWRGMRRNPTSDSSMMDCCAPGKQPSTVESDRLMALRAQRKELEREIANL